MKLSKEEKQMLDACKTRKDRRLCLLAFWLEEFPCELYYNNPCILEDITPEMLYKFINKNE